MSIRLARAKTIRFRKGRVHAKPALALIYDLAGFSTFANRPDAAQWISPFLNHVSQAIEIVIYGGEPYWLPDEGVEYYRLREQAHQKFLGDGVLYIWTGTQHKPLDSFFIRTLCVRLRDLRANFSRVVRAAREKIQIAEIPQDIRFGLAVGDVYELGRTDARQREYVGICINLAARLQKYYPGVGFVAARVQMTPTSRRAENFVRVIANKIDGFPSEYVLLDEAEYAGLDRNIRGTYFERIK